MTSSPVPSPTVPGSLQTVEFRLGPWRVEPAADRMVRGEQTVHLEPKVMAVLILLAERAGTVVDKEEVLTAVWPDTVVSEVSLPRVISDLRRALDDDARQPRYIETIPKKGYRLIAEVEIDPESEPRSARRGWRLLAAVAVLLSVGGLVWWQLSRADDVAGIESLAVLPLRNLSTDPEEEYFADAMTDLVITDLAKLGCVRVISGTSVLRYKHHRQPLPVIARELGVDAIVEGTILRAAERVRITVQLIDGPADQHLWAESYERRFDDILALQGEVARSIAMSVAENISPERLARLDRPRPAIDPVAYDLYLKGRERWQQRWKKNFHDELHEAIAYYEQSIAADSHNPYAYAGLSDAYLVEIYLDRPHEEVVSKAKRAALRALRLDPELAEAHISLAMIRFLFEWDWYSAELHFRRGLELDPNYATGHQWYGLMLASLGRFDEALREAEEAIRLDPFSVQTRRNAKRIFHLARRYERVIEEIENLRQVETADSDYDELEVLAIRWLREGSPQIREQLRELLSPTDPDAWDPFVKACGHAALGEIEEAFAWLDEALRIHSSALVDLSAEPLLDPLRDDPRFHKLLDEVGLNDLPSYVRGEDEGT